MKKQVAIIHYNTPELTEAAILSLRKNTGTRYDVTVFDNSDKRPFNAKMQGVKVIDNTKGKYIDFEAELEKFPNKCWEMAKKSNSTVPAYMEVDLEALKATLVREPNLDEIPVNVQIMSVIEYYAR